MPPSRLSPRLCGAILACAFVVAACGTAGGSEGRITSVRTDDEAAADTGDPTADLEKGASGGSDPTDVSASGSGKGVSGGHSGGSDPVGTGTSTFAALFGDNPLYQQFVGVLESTYTVDYKVSPPLVWSIHVVNLPPQQSVHTRFLTGLQTWTLYTGLSMVVDCTKPLGAGWSCSYYETPVDPEVPTDLGLDFGAIQDLRFHAAYLSALALMGSAESMATTTSTVLGQPVTCYSSPEPSSTVCINSAGVVLQATGDMGIPVTVEASAYSATADPAALVPPA